MAQVSPDPLILGGDGSAARRILALGLVDDSQTLALPINADGLGSGTEPGKFFAGQKRLRPSKSCLTIAL
jgi:hypothetical protein